MARPQHAKTPEKDPYRWVWIVGVLLAAGLLAIPATAQDAPTTCDFSDSHLHNGWGWDEEGEQSCHPVQDSEDVDFAISDPGVVDAQRVEVQPEPAIEPTAPTVATVDDSAAEVVGNAPLMVGTCDYSKSHHFNGYGWDEIDGVSCEPLLTTSTTEYVAPEPGSPEDTCDYTKSHLHNGYGFDHVNGIHCLPMDMRIARAEQKRATAEPAVASPLPSADVSPPVHPDDWDGDQVPDRVDDFPFDPNRF